MAKRLLVEIIGDSSSLERSLKSSSHAAEGFGSKLSGLGKIAGFTAGSAAIGALVVGLDKSFHAAVEGQVSQGKLTAALKATHQSATAMAGALEAAQAASRTLGFTNDQTREALAKLEVATGNTKSAITDLSVAQDIARFKNIDLAAASQTLAQAMGGSQRAAKQLGIVVSPVTANLDALKASSVDLTTATGRVAEAHAKLLDKMATGQAVIDATTAKVKGQSQAYADTAAGGMAQFHAQLQNVEENIGNALLPAMQNVLTWVNAHWPEISAAISNAMKTIGPTLDQFRTTVRIVMADAEMFWNRFGGTIEKTLRGAITVIRDQLAVIRSIFQIFGDVLSGNWSQLWHDLGGLASNVMHLLVDELRALVAPLLDVGKALGSAFVKGMSAGLSALGGALESLIRAPINAIISAWDAIGFHTPGLKVLGQTVIPSINFSVPQIPKLDMGGVVAQTGLAVVHRGEEWSGVGAHRRPLGGGGGGNTYNFSFPNYVGSKAELISTVRDGLTRLQRTEPNLFGTA